MLNSNNKRIWRWGILVAIGLPACAERLALRNYTTSDGLPSSYIERIAADSRGLLWFCTRDGLSRFDGSRFVNYSVQHGLPIPHINHLLETRKGVYWVATNGGGVARFDPAARGKAPGSGPGSPTLFTTFPVGSQPMTNSVNILYEDRHERLWAGTDSGAFRLEEHDGRFEFRRFAIQTEAPVTSFAEDSGGDLWIATYAGVARIAAGDRLVPQPYARIGRVNSLLCDRAGNLWLGTGDDGLIAVHPDGTQRRFSARDGLPGDHVSALQETADGHIWVAGNGLAEFDGVHFQTYTKEQGLEWVRRGGLAKDQDGNLWVITVAGALKLALSGFSSYGAADGLGRIHSIHEDREGSLIVTGITTDEHVSIHCFVGKRFLSVGPRLPAGAKAVWPNQGALRDRSGEWWLLTREGLWRFPAIDLRQLAFARPSAIYDRSRGLVRDSVSALYEDRQGDLWIGSASQLIGGLTRWDRRTDRLQAYSEADGIPANWNTPTAFVEDRAGRLWVGFQFGGLARQDGGRFRTFGVRDGSRQSGVTALHMDQAGRLWVATVNGVVRVDDIEGDEPHFTGYAITDGLSSNNIRCLTDDRWGRIYLGSARGIDRLDPRTGRVRHYDMGDGLSSDFINAAYRDRQGVLWFGTYTGLSRLEPRYEEPLPPPPIWIDRVRIAGVAHPVSEIGEREIPELTLAANGNNVQIDFFSLNFQMGQTLRYQFMLEGADREWGPPSDQRTVYYASLSPGSYRFFVRAVNAEGVWSPSPAVVSFQVLGPFWKRWWFLLMAALAITSILGALHRFRVKGLIEVERLRRRIAADLHDDIGASLSRVAILSEVVKRQVGQENGEPAHRLSEIADTARGLVDSMSDIVWSVDPRRDDLHNVVLRVRQFAYDILEGRSISWDLTAPQGLEKVKLNPEQRRHLYLILKESVANIARHSGSGCVTMVIRLDSSHIRAEVRDDGCGFDSAKTNGHGLENMRSRAAQLGGAISVETAVGSGTKIILDVPLKRFGA